MILEIAVYLSYALVLLSLVFCFVRLIIGPKMADRITAIDTLYVNVVVLLVIMGVHLQTTVYFIAAVLIAGIGFIGTIALCKFLLRGNIME
jgi:multicomponent K+:H+ antiporter subunit F